MGYEYKKDVLWFEPKSDLVCINNNSEGYTYENECGNIIHSKSKVNVEFCGWNSCVEIGKNVRMPQSTIRVGHDVRIIIKDNSNLASVHLGFLDGISFEVGEKVEICGMAIFINNESTVIIGKNTTMSTRKLRTGRNQRIEIGEDCMISWDVVFLAHDGHLIWDVYSEKCLNNTDGYQRKSIKIGNHVWVGEETVIMPNTEIGSGTLCGYRSLVKGKIPNNCIVAGSPAKVVRKDIAWSRANVSNDNGDFKKYVENIECIRMKMFLIK